MRDLKPLAPKLSQWESEIAEAIGVEALAKLEDKFGRSYVYIPTTPKPQIVECIGAEAAAKLSKIYGSFDIYVPRALLKQLRNNRIRERISAGSSVAEVQAEFNLSPKWIRQIKQEASDD
ncbi:Mor transcription activator family protein [Shewanella sp.]|uniref:Mor transcription activator family protein n=1 Tax=Shewanella sp. TaxID=50422 RepID=UPI003F2DE32D